VVNFVNYSGRHGGRILSRKLDIYNSRKHMLSLTDKAFIVVELSFYWRMTLLAKLATFEERGAIDFDRGSKASYRWLMTVPRGDMGVFTWIVYLRDRLNRSLTGTCRRSSSRWKHWPPSVTEISRSLNPFQWRMGNWSNLFTVSVNIWVNTLEKKTLDQAFAVPCGHAVSTFRSDGGY